MLLGWLRRAEAEVSAPLDDDALSRKSKTAARIRATGGRESLRGDDRITEAHVVEPAISRRLVARQSPKLSHVASLIHVKRFRWRPVQRPRLFRD